MQDCLLYSRAFWVTKSIIAWNVDVGTDGSCFLYASQNAALSITESGVQGLDSTPYSSDDILNKWGLQKTVKG